MTIELGFAFMAITMAFQLWFAIQKLRGLSVPEEPEPRHVCHGRHVGQFAQLLSNFI